MCRILNVGKKGSPKREALGKSFSNVDHAGGRGARRNSSATQRRSVSLTASISKSPSTSLLS